MVARLGCIQAGQAGLALRAQPSARIIMPCSGVRRSRDTHWHLPASIPNPALSQPSRPTYHHPAVRCVRMWEGPEYTGRNS